MLAALARMPLFLVGPLVCHVRGHHWHVWSFHAAQSIHVCVRCGFIVDDPLRKGTA